MQYMQTNILRKIVVRTKHNVKLCVDATQYVIHFGCKRNFPNPNFALQNFLKQVLDKLNQSKTPICTYIVQWFCGIYL